MATEFKVFGLLAFSFGKQHLAPQICLFGAQFKQGVLGLVAVCPARYLTGPTSFDPAARFAPVMSQLITDDECAAHLLWPS